LICAVLDHVIVRESAAKGICQECFNQLPKVTRDLYKGGGLSVKRVGELARMRQRTAKELRSGHYTRPK
jgi:hypothetical protein